MLVFRGMESFPSDQASSALHISLAADLERIQTDSLIPPTESVPETFVHNYFTLLEGIYKSQWARSDLGSTLFWFSTQDCQHWDHVLTSNRGKVIPHQLSSRVWSSPLPVGPKCLLSG